MEAGVSLRTGQLVQQLVRMKHQHRSDTDGAFVHPLKMVGNIAKVCINESNIESTQIRYRRCLCP